MCTHNLCFELVGTASVIFCRECLVYFSLFDRVDGYGPVYNEELSSGLVT